MSGNKLLIAMFFGLVMVACTNTPMSVVQTDNPGVNVSLLFVDSDGCKVNRFEDYGVRHYVVCPRDVEVSPTMWDEGCGKGCVRNVTIGGGSL